jgi:transitional endoplasmic reticulum ATPase
MPLAKDVKIEKLADLTDGYVGADIEALCREAAMTALRKNMKTKEVKMGHFESAMDGINPTMSDEMKTVYEEVLKRFKKRTTTKYDERLKYVG